MIQTKTVFASKFDSDAETAAWALPEGATLVAVTLSADQSGCDRNEVLVDIQFTLEGGE